MTSPALIGRLREFEFEIETELAAELEADRRFAGDSALTAALLVAAYRTVALETMRRRLAGGDLTAIAAAHRQRLTETFPAVAHGLPVTAPRVSAETRAAPAGGLAADAARRCPPPVISRNPSPSVTMPSNGGAYSRDMGVCRIAIRVVAGLVCVGEFD
jgi:hypothetical protein